MTTPIFKCSIDLFTSCIPSGLVSRDCYRIMPCRSVPCVIRIRRVRKIWEYVSCTDFTVQENNFELISTIKMLTRHPVGGSCGSKFPSICNHCGVGSLKSKDVKIFRKFCVFKTNPYGKMFRNFVPKVFIATLVDVMCSNFVKFVWREIGEIVRCLPDIFRLALQLSLMSGWRLKSARAGPRQCYESAPDFIQIGSFGRRAERVNKTKTRCKVNPIFGWSLASSRVFIMLAEFIAVSIM